MFSARNPVVGFM